MPGDLAFVRDLVRDVGDDLLGVYRRGDREATLKRDFSLVTEWDIAADRRIAQAIAAEYPRDVVLSEELQPVCPAGGHAVWVVDPIDGTTNFTLGVPFWGVSVARVVEGRPQAAAVYFPAVGELFAAAEGAGATLNGEPTRARAPSAEQPIGILAGCSRAPKRYHMEVPLKRRILGSAAYSLCAVAGGVAALGFETDVRVWDVAAAWLIVAEAGGAVESFRGPSPFPLVAGTDYHEVRFDVLAAADEALRDLAHERIRPR